MSKEASNVKVHFFYVTLILGGALIGVMTNAWTKLEGFTDYLSVAATITSLVLGVLAIIYAFVSTGSMNQFLGSIDASNSAMARVASDLKDVLTRGEQAQLQATQSASELSQLARTLSSSIESLSTTTQNIKGTVDTLPSSIESLQKHLSAGTVNMADGFPEGPQSPAGNAHFYVKKSSTLGLAAVKLALEAGDAGVKVQAEPVFENTLADYCQGFLMATEAAAFIALDTDIEGETLAFSAQALNPAFRDILDEEWASREASNDKLESYLATKHTADIRQEIARRTK